MEEIDLEIIGMLKEFREGLSMEQMMKKSKKLEKIGIESLAGHLDNLKKLNFVRSTLKINGVGGAYKLYMLTSDGSKLIP